MTLQRTDPLHVVATVPNWDGGRGGMDRVMSVLRDAIPGLDDGSRVRLTLLNTRSYGPRWTIPIAFLCAFGWCALQMVTGRIHLMHLNLAKRGSAVRKLMFCSLCRLMGVPFVVHLHGSGFDQWYRTRRRVYQLLISRMFTAAKCVVVLGEHWASFVTTVTGGDARVEIVYNGAPSAYQGAIERSEDRECRIATLGEVGWRKGTDVLLDSLAALMRTMKNWHCVIAGNGDVALFDRQAAERGLSGHVKFVGWLSPLECQSLLLSCDIFVLPSRAENCPMAIVEAMGAGRPIVATPVGAIPELVRSGVEGILVPVGDAGSLTSALERLIEDDDLRWKMGTAARDRHRLELTPEQMAGKILRVWLLAVGCSGKPRSKLVARKSLWRRDGE